LVIIEVSFKIIPEKEFFVWDNPKSSPAPVKPVCVAAIYDWSLRVELTKRHLLKYERQFVRREKSLPNSELGTITLKHNNGKN